jgi:hypothetical protein
MNDNKSSSAAHSVQSAVHLAAHTSIDTSMNNVNKRRRGDENIQESKGMKKICVRAQPSYPKSRGSANSQRECSSDFVEWCDYACQFVQCRFDHMSSNGQNMFIVKREHLNIPQLLLEIHSYEYCIRTLTSVLQQCKMHVTIAQHGLIIYR